MRCGSGYPCPPYKLIILDEADSMTKDAQSALRRTMEVYTRVTRFALLCNYVSRIIDPIKSRCAKFRYQPLSHSAMKQRLTHIARMEHIDVEGGGEGTGRAEAEGQTAQQLPSAQQQTQALAEEERRAPLDLLCDLSGGDLRLAITLLQTASRLLPRPSAASDASTSPAPAQLTSAHLLDVSCITPRSFILRLHSALRTNSFATLQSTVQEMVAEGFDSQSVLQGWLNVLLADESIEERKKARICSHMAVVEKRLVDGSDEQLQILDLLAAAATTIHAR